MKVVIIEDEYHAARRLTNLIQKIEPTAKIMASLDSVEESVEWWQQNTAPDLLFMDIQLADGLSFDIFKKVEINTPVVFTTAYDEYALQAFKANSVDYLLKPIDEEELGAAIKKFQEIHSKSYDTFAVEELLRSVQKKEYAQRFLIKSGEQFLSLPIGEVAYFYSEDSLTFARTRQNKKHLIEYTLDDLYTRLDPTRFYRVNRKFILGIEAIKKIHTYFNHRLKLDMQPAYSEGVVVSRERVKGFKKWLGE